MKIAIVDYGMGNLFSVRQALSVFCPDVKVATSAAELRSADAIVLPGVGAFAKAMSELAKHGMDEAILLHASKERPLLGICLGLQLFFSTSEEHGSNQGLNLIPGTVRRFPELNGNASVRTPQIGWNQIRSPDGDAKWKSAVFGDLAQGEYMWFVHSFFAVPSNRDNILSETEYGGIRYCSSVAMGHTVGFQFHPEKSGAAGMTLLRGWYESSKAK